jgi:uncharacterized protein (DUF58 family)
VTTPTARAIWLAAAGFPAALLPALVHPRLWGAWLFWFAGTLLLVGLDAVLCLPRRLLAAEAAVPDTLGIGQPGAVEIRVSSPRPIEVEVLCELHDDFDSQPARSLAAGPGREAVARIPLVARRRGRPSVDEIWLRWHGPLGLVRRQARTPVGRAVAVVPNVAPVRQAAFRYFGSREMAAGVQVERFVGDGSEFDALREHVPGLDPRTIDWKASARHRRLLGREFRAERNHQVVMALDTGHLMGEPLEGLPRLDHAVTSALLLAYVSLRLGDRVGLFGFDRTARLWTEPQGGLGAFPRVRAATAQLDYSTDETNFTLGLAELSTRLRRRSLVVVFTEFVDTVTAELMVENLFRLARRHLVVFVALRDPSLDAIALGRPERLSDVFRAVVAADFVRERELVLARLRRDGIRCVDAVPRAVSAGLLNRYLEVKRRELV